MGPASIYTFEMRRQTKIVKRSFVIVFNKRAQGKYFIVEHMTEVAAIFDELAHGDLQINVKRALLGNCINTYKAQIF